MLIHLVCAARPNFMKATPLYQALKKEQWAEPVIVHTGQHFDFNMRDPFFEDLDYLSRPNNPEAILCQLHVRIADALQ